MSKTKAKAQTQGLPKIKQILGQFPTLLQVLESYKLRLSDQIEQVYDKVSQYAMGREPMGFVSFILPGLPQGTVIKRTISIRPSSNPFSPLLLCDRVYLLSIPGELDSLLNLEMQSKIRYDEARRGLAYTNGFWQDDKVHAELGLSGVPVFIIFVFLTGDIDELKIDVSLKGTNLKLQAEFGCFCFSRVDAKAFLDDVAQGKLSPELLHWVPLMKGADQDEVVIQWKQLAESHFQFEDLANLSLSVVVFSELAKRDEVWKKHVKELRLVQSTFLKEILDQMAEEKFCEIVEKSVAKTKAEGVAEGEVKGEAKSLKATLLLLLTDKFRASKERVEEMRSKLESEMDLNRLNQWVASAINARSLRAFRAASGL